MSAGPESEEGSINLPDSFRDIIDQSTFSQILDMDDDPDDREFSSSIVFSFFEQAESTFQEIDTALENGNLPQLSALGHFLKGSSATLGLTKVKDHCEKIQHFGSHKDETGTKDEPSDAVCLRRIRETVAQTKDDYHEAEKILKEFFNIPLERE